MVENRVQRLKGVRRETWVDGVICDILSRLPVKSICSFKTVCKSWNGLMSDRFFAKKHFLRSRKNPTFISCPSMDAKMKLYSIRHGSLKFFKLNTINPAERSPENYMYMISSFNGLICCVNHISEEDVENGFCDLQIWICNPCTGETLLLPQSRPSFEVEPSVGVAYAPDSSDYRVFRIFCVREKTPQEMVSTVLTGYPYTLAYECEVYSSSTGSWKNIGPVPRVPMHPGYRPFSSSHILAGGKLFWLVSLEDEGEILSVDLEGRFEVFNLPPYPDDSRDEDSITEATYLINLQGSLAVVIRHPSDMDVWVRKNEGEEFSWVCVCRSYTPFRNFEIVLSMTSSKNKILCVSDTHWRSFDVDTGKWERKRAPLSGFVNPSVFPFTESVLTCNGGVML